MSSCVFCAIAAGEKPDQHVVAADEHTVAFLDIRPVFKGHVLVIPACTSMSYRALTGTGHLFWPHARYADQAEQASYARRLSEQLPGARSSG